MLTQPVPLAACDPLPASQPVPLALHAGPQPQPGPRGRAPALDQAGGLPPGRLHATTSEEEAEPGRDAGQRAGAEPRVAPDGESSEP